MTLSHVYKNVNEIMQLVEEINFLTYDKSIQTINQRKVNQAYFKLDELKDELIREHIKNKQKVAK